ncbi:MAG TPA: riboflavin synthase [Blastocatellia bacterium]|nr:riboflavin synthase [Blastocatellia bacterium]
MFTGIVEETGSIKKVTSGAASARVEVAARTVLEGAKVGDSIAVNGVCLTVVGKTNDSFSADVSAETLRRTSLRQIRAGSRVNLERPLLPTSRLGGHIVQGHVDGVGEFLEARPEGEGWIVRVGFPAELGRYIVEKGSITVDGISLTVAALGDDWFEIAVIPHTWHVTNLSSLRRGDAVNLEVDIIAKYVERLLGPHAARPQSNLTIERLRKLGY